MRLRGVIALGLAVGAVGIGYTEAGSAAAASDSARPKQMSLAEALKQPRGPAAGDKVMRLHADAGPAAGVHADAAGVNAGTKRQAPNIPQKKTTRAEGLAAAAKVFTSSAATAGCALGYGTHGACLPSVSPGSAAMGGMAMAWTCPEVRQIFPQGIALTTAGVDPQHLDANHNGTACDKGD